MTPLTDKAWEALLRAERATAQCPPSAESFRRAAAAYEQGGFPDIALAVLRKVSSFGFELKTVLPILLRGHRKRRQFAELNTHVQAALAIDERAPGLRRELALALASLGQGQAADGEWASLLRDGFMTENDWLNCAQSIATCADAPALEQVMAAIAERPQLRTSPTAAYCAAKHLVDRDLRDLTAALDVLQTIDPARIPDPDIQLDLAILAFRLRDYARAETAATLAASAAADPTPSRNILASIRSFAGDPSGLRKIPLSIPPEAQAQVSAFARTVERSSAAWGFLERRGPDSFAAQPLDLTPDPDMTVPEDADPIATFSILSENLNPDLFHILCGVLWSWPHCVLQRKPGGDVLHFFIEAKGHRYWMWEEVSPELRHSLRKGTRVGPQPSATWSEAQRELAQESTNQP